MPPRKAVSSEGNKSKQDIRSFFKVSKPSKCNEKPINLSDDDTIPESPDATILIKKKESRKKRVLEDSDEEIFTTKTKKSREEDRKSKKEAKNDKNKLKEVKAVDIFGSAPIKRTEPLVTKPKKIKTETGIHSDEEFEKSLLELDNGTSCDSSENKSVTDMVNNKEGKSKYFKDKTPKKEKEESKNAESQNVPEKIIKDEIKEIPEIETKKKLDSNKYKIPKIKSTEVKEEIKVKVEKKPKSPLKSKENTKNDKKRDFSEFIGGDEEATENDEHESKNKKKKINTSLNESVLTDEERYEKKRHSAALYKNYLNRSGPKNLGAKEIPEGTTDCLKDCAFLLTGVLESFEREEIAEAIAKYGGTVKSGVSKKVTHVIAGDDAGPAKLAKATDLGIKILNEDEFLQMIKVNSSKNGKVDDKRKDHKSSNHKSDRDDKPAKKVKSQSDVKVEAKHTKDSDNRNESKKKPTKASPESMKNFEDKIKKSFYSKSKTNETKDENHDQVKSKPKEESRQTNGDEREEINKDTATTTPVTDNALMWVDKYKPQNVKQIIGQHGDSSNVKKLTNWLTKWYVNRKSKIPKPSPWAKNDDGAYFKAALLSGPPGVGKTTTVSLVCKELGFDTVEFNASDTRSKNLIREQIGELLSTNSLAGFAKGETNKKAVSKKHVLVMDEVDGMAGNEDRGGLQELISLIKTTSVPVICMCNDRNSEKMRSLVNYCFDLKFSRPRVDQIRGAMLSVCFKEGIKIPTEALNQLIVASNQDVRQTLNGLSMWAANPDILDADKLKKDAQNTKKDMKLGSWEAVRKVFSAEDHKTMSIHDKSDLFFYDYSMAPLFVQENYLSVVPHCPKNEILKRISDAADNISAGDLVDAKIRGNQAWSLLPLQAMYSSVLPGSLMSGHVGGQIQFPGWLGKNSRANKMKRLAAELHAHTRLSTTGSKSSIFMDYSAHLRDAIVKPLIKDKAEGIERAIDVLQSYHLLREDLDSLNELALWPGQRDPMILVDSKVKAAMTRAYNKLSPALPHSAASFSKVRGARADDADDMDGEEDDVQDDGNPENDALIKVKKKTEPKSKSSDNPGTSKEKGKKGKGKK